MTDEGRFDEVVPHLTIGHDAPLDDLRAAGREVVTRLPITMVVNAVQLMCGTTAPGSVANCGARRFDHIGDHGDAPFVEVGRPLVNRIGAAMRESARTVR